MPTPIKPLPDAVVSWTRRTRWLRWLDAVAAWLVFWVGMTMAVRGAESIPRALLAAVLVAAGTVVSPLRVRWRPLSGCVALVVSRPLRPGDRAWYVRPGQADLVLVTARRGLRMVIAQPALGAAEAIAVRRTRVLLLPADSL